jgi:iron complex transport system substrate-binding protein
MRELIVILFALLPGLCHAAERVVTVAPNLTELVCAVGACDKLVGVDQRSDYPESVKKVAKVGDAFSLNLEAILALKPDLVIAWETGTDAQRMRRLEKLGLHVVWVRVNTLDEIGDGLIKVGMLIGGSAEQSAVIAAQTYKSRLQALRARQQPVNKLGVLYQIDLQPIYTINQKSPISEAIALCGGRNVFADLPQLAGIVSVESVLARNPDVILFPDELKTEIVEKQWQRWPNLKAVKHHALYNINDSLLARASPRMLDGVERLCTILGKVSKNYAG